MDLDPPADRAPPRASRAADRAEPGAAAREASRHNLKSLFKLIDILDCFSTLDRELSVTEIARRTRMPKSTAHRLADSLRAVGFLEQDASRDHYRLGLKLFELGSTVLANMPLHREARPFVDSLTKLSGEAVHLCVFDGTHMVTVERAEPATSAHNTLTTMEASTCYSTGVGKATLAFQSEAVIEKVIRLGLRPLTRSTIIDPQRLREELALTRSRGYAFDDGEHEPSVRCVGAPIRNVAGRVFAAISVTGPARRFPDERIEPLAELVISHAAAISARLGYRGEGV
jgi:IclR family transcriptional regulator, KDG regulon repressor